jgi:hypothetical protein
MRSGAQGGLGAVILESGLMMCHKGGFLANRAATDENKKSRLANSPFGVSNAESTPKAIACPKSQCGSSISQFQIGACRIRAIYDALGIVAIGRMNWQTTQKSFFSS